MKNLNIHDKLFNRARNGTILCSKDEFHEYENWLQPQQRIWIERDGHRGLAVSGKILLIKSHEKSQTLTT